MNSPFTQTQPKKKLQTVANDSILESLRGIGSGVGKTVLKDVAGQVATDTLTTIFGGIPKTGELKPNQSFSFTPEEQKPVEQRPMTPAARPEFRVDRGALIQKDQEQIKQQLQAVRIELKALSQTIKNFSLDVQKAIDEVPVDPGVYHLNFLDRLKSFLKLLREQIQDSGAWLSLSTNRKKKKGYWGMYKKHGTKFGLSNERTSATQAG